MKNQKESIDPVSPEAIKTDNKTPFRIYFKQKSCYLNDYFDFVFVANEENEEIENGGEWWCITIHNVMEAESRAYIIQSYTFDIDHIESLLDGSEIFE